MDNQDKNQETRTVPHMFTNTSGPKLHAAGHLSVRFVYPLTLTPKLLCLEGFHLFSSPLLTIISSFVGAG